MWGDGVVELVVKYSLGLDNYMVVDVSDAVVVDVVVGDVVDAAVVIDPTMPLLVLAWSTVTYW